jgi:hypothetical protein
MVTPAEIDEQSNQLLAQRATLELVSIQLAERMRQVRVELDALLAASRDKTMQNEQSDVRSEHARQLRAEGSELVEQGKQIATQQLQIFAQLDYLSRQRQQLAAS